MIRCEFSKYHIKFLDMKMIIEYVISKKGRFFGYMGLGSWGVGLKNRQRGSKIKAPSKVFIFSKVENF